MGKSKNDWERRAYVGFSGRTFDQDFVNFQSFIFPGLADFSLAIFVKDADFRDAIFNGVAAFKKATFTGGADFSEATFTRDVLFDEAIFTEDAKFFSATFIGDAGFSEAIFTEDAKFFSVTFRGHAYFFDATFSKRANFRGANFGGYALFPVKGFGQDASFRDVVFEKAAFFENAPFKGEAHFYGIMANRAFSMGGTTFETVPNFIQASFKEPPRLDDIKIPETPAAPVPAAPEADSMNKSPDYDNEAKFRALRRVAIVAHDHEREMNFFAGEILARRAKPEWWKNPMMILSYPYQWFSDFGRSMVLPLLWFLCTWLWFALGYAFFGAGAVRVALELSFRRMLFAFDRGGQKMDGLYGCLGGPFVYTEILQSLFSSILIFLFILSVRNHFRIR